MSCTILVVNSFILHYCTQNSCLHYEKFHNYSNHLPAKHNCCEISSKLENFDVLGAVLLKTQIFWCAG